MGEKRGNDVARPGSAPRKQAESPGSVTSGAPEAILLPRPRRADAASIRDTVAGRRILGPGLLPDRGRDHHGRRARRLRRHPSLPRGRWRRPCVGDATLTVHGARCPEAMERLRADEWIRAGTVEVCSQAKPVGEQTPPMWAIPGGSFFSIVSSSRARPRKARPASSAAPCAAATTTTIGAARPAGWDRAPGPPRS